MGGHIDDEGMSQRLSSLDATFLELEDADEAAHMHIGAVMVFEATPRRDRRRSTSFVAEIAAPPRAAPAISLEADRSRTSAR